jgi:prevent-host-death family protein
MQGERCGTLFCLADGELEEAESRCVYSHLETDMTISVTELKARCLEIIREVEANGEVVEITHRGEIVARLLPATAAAADVKPWHRLHGTAKLLATPEESVLKDSDFEALR